MNVNMLAKVIALSFIVSLAAGCGRGVIKIHKNEYRGMLIAIGDSVPEDYTLIERLKKIFTEASAYLYKVTKKRAYFGDITILVPKSWSDRAEYEPRTRESEDRSDVQVDQTFISSLYGDRPFVVKVTPCGAPGHYMHLTPKYVLNDTIAKAFGPYEKTLIHEWAHLRYGVFDEYPHPRSNQHFYAARNGEIEGIRCSSAIQGRFYDVVRQTERCLFENGLPDKNCRFQPQTGNIRGEYGSLMYSQQLDHIEHFCDNDRSSPLTLHNREATTRQNQLCDGRSVWEVMREHADFRNNANPPVNVSSTVPTFRLVKEVKKRTVLVLDVSGSMDDHNRIRKLARAVFNYIKRVIHDGEQLGIVTFSEEASIKSRLLVIDKDTRKELLKHVPRKANGPTSIGDGILKGLDVLSDRSGGKILLISDGKETHPPWVEDVRQKVINADVTVDTIAISRVADAQLEDLAEVSGGLSFFFSDSDNSNALNEAFIASSDQGRPIIERSLQILSESFILSPGETWTDTLMFDSSIGLNADVAVGYSVTTPEVTITTASGHVFDSSSPEYNNDVDFNTTSFFFPDIGEAGGVKLTITNNEVEFQTVSLTVKSRYRKSQTFPILAHAQWKSTTFSYPDLQMLYVTISQGMSPILNANVEASLEQPAPDGEDAIVVPLKLQDNGAGADTMLDDGVYSTYVTNFTRNGRYYVKVLVNDSPTSVVSRDRVVGLGAAGGPNERIGKTLEPREQTEQFQRFTSAGSFTLLNYSPDTDMYPPCKITDLVVTSVGVKQVRLEWTAPGDDLDSGTASRYELWMSADFDSLYDSHNATTPVTTKMLMEGRLDKPLEAGTREYVVVSTEQEGDVTFYFVILGIDDASNRGARSNIVSASMKYVNHDSEPNVAMIAGIAIGVTAVVLIVAIIVGVVIYQKSTAAKYIPDGGKSPNAVKYCTNEPASSKFNGP